MNCVLWAVFQNGRFGGDADLERQKLSDLKLSGPQVILRTLGWGCFIAPFCLHSWPVRHTGVLRGAWRLLSTHALVSFTLEGERVGLSCPVF